MGSCRFWSKTAEHSAWCGQVRSQITHHEMGTCQTQSLTTTPAGTDTDGLLEHSSSGGRLYYKGPALQEITSVLGGPPS